MSKTYQSAPKTTSAKMVLFGKKIKQTRLLAGYTQLEVTTLMGFSSNGTISQIENGKSGLELANIWRYAEVVGVAPEVLIDNIDYTDDEMRFHMAYYEVMHNPNHPMRPAIEAILNPIASDIGPPKLASVKPLKRLTGAKK